MKNKVVCFLSFFQIFVISIECVYAQDHIIEKEITADSYRIFLTYNDNSFFTGSVEIFDRYNNSVFYADSLYTHYNSDTVIDLNADGSRELILDLSTGATMYDYNMFLIFDLSKKHIEPFEIHNAQLVNGIDEQPKIESEVRLSPNYLGAGYAYSLKYEDGKMILETDPSESKVLKSLDLNERDILEQIEGYESETDVCSEESQIQVYYEAYITQRKFSDRKARAGSFLTVITNAKIRKK
ncbi:MAG: hypothetical protein IPH77_19800 [Ignavibacteria bacterium]|nr:hypothetical protein [Ignavibacteria bacterium]